MKTLIFDCALLTVGWANNVAVKIDDAGYIADVKSDVPDRTGEHITGCLLPGVPNLHSHAHQRVMAGLAERSSNDGDDFWSWREVMYDCLSRLEPHHLQAIAAQLYIEMLKSGYTSVAEFQYLHHDPQGQPYENVAEMSLRTLAAAVEVGIGITNLPVLYRYSDFGAQEPRSGQRRFLNDADRFLRIVQTLIEQSGDNPNVTTGIAAHSLRAIQKELLEEVIMGFDGSQDRPIHMHIAEQIEEVDLSLAWCNQRPVEWLYSNLEIDERWCLVHATHLSEAEIEMVARSKAVVGLCPTTEANLGDGLFDAVLYTAADGRIGVGSDSHVSVSPVEELRWLEYGQRLKHLSRNVLAGGDQRSTGRHIFELALAGGAQACGRQIGQIEPGYRADMIVIETDHPLLFNRREDALLDSWIFSGNSNLVRDVYVGGKAVIKDGIHAMDQEISLRFRRVLDELSA